MSSLQKQIRDAVMVKLQTIPGVKSVLRAPRQEIGDADFPVICLFSHGDRPLSEEDDQEKSHQRVYTLRVEIRVLDRPEDDATDGFCIAIRKAILADDSLGRLANRITWIDQQWDGVENEKPLAGSVVDFNVYYTWRPE